MNETTSISCLRYVQASCCYPKCDCFGRQPSQLGQAMAPHGCICPPGSEQRRERHMIRETTDRHPNVHQSDGMVVINGCRLTAAQANEFANLIQAAAEEAKLVGDHRERRMSIDIARAMSRG